MAIVVEDGTGLSNADSFVAVADADSHFTNYHPGASWDSADLADKEAALRRATRWLSRYFRWKGDPVNGRSQALAWPRSGVTDCDDLAVPSDAVPVEVQMATFAAALYELDNPGGLTPEVVPWAQAKREKVGPIEVEYRELESTRTGEDTRIDDSRVILAKVEDYLRCLVNRRTLTSGPFIA